MFIELSFIQSINECVSELEMSFLDGVQDPERGGGWVQ